MKKLSKYVLLLLLLFPFVVSAEEIKVSNIRLNYDESSGIVVNDKVNKDFNIELNDLDQDISLTATITNTTDKTLTVRNIEVSSPTFNFTSYKVEGIKTGEKIEANKSATIKLNIKTKENTDIAENFVDNVIVTVIADKPVVNPKTGVLTASALILLWLVISMVYGVYKRNNKVFKSLVIIVAMMPVIGIITVKADNQVVFKLDGLVSYKSQNVLEPARDPSAGNPWTAWDFWEHASSIRNIYIKTKIETPTTYAYEYDVSSKKDGRVMAYLIDNDYTGSGGQYYDLYLMTNGTLYLNENASYTFSGMSYLDKFEGMEYIRTDYSTNFSNLFNYTTVYDGGDRIFDLRKWNTSNVTTMASMFTYVGSPNTNKITFILDGWDLSNVVTMERMFMDLMYYSKYIDCDITFSLKNWDVSHVTNFSYMFECLGRYVPNIKFELSGWTFNESSKVDYMFMNFGAESRNAEITLKDMKFLNGAKGLLNNGGDTSDGKIVYNLENLEIHKDMSYFLARTGHRTGRDIQINFKNCDTSNVENMASVFTSTTGLNELDLTCFDTRKVKTMYDIFGDSLTLEKIYVSDRWSVDAITNNHEYVISADTPVLKGQTYNGGPDVLSIESGIVTKKEQ